MISKKLKTPIPANTAYALSFYYNSNTNAINTHCTVAFFTPSFSMGPSFQLPQTSGYTKYEAQFSGSSDPIDVLTFDIQCDDTNDWEIFIDDFSIAIS